MKSIMSNSLKLPLSEQSAIIEIVEIIRSMDNNYIGDYKDYHKYIGIILDMDYNIVMYDMIKDVDFQKCKAMKSMINFVDYYYDIFFDKEESIKLKKILKKMGKFIIIEGKIK